MLRGQSEECVWWVEDARRETRECRGATWVHQGCEFEFETESCGDPLKKRRGVVV